MPSLLTTPKRTSFLALAVLASAVTFAASNSAALLTGCSSQPSASPLVVADAGADASAHGSELSAATPTGDGTPGFCCEPSLGGGCIFLGGYHEEGSPNCDAYEACDNLGEQRIVDDVHGCKKGIYEGASPRREEREHPDAGDAGDASG